MSDKPTSNKMEMAAKSILKRLFSVSPLADEVTPKEIFLGLGRPIDDEPRNRAWLSNQLTTLRKVNYISSVYDKSNRKRLVQIRLTPEGRAALGRNGTAEIDEAYIAGEQRSINERISLESLVSILKAFEKQNPSIEISFRIDVKDEEEDRRPRYPRAYFQHR